jgi:hypothetical protein
MERDRESLAGLLYRRSDAQTASYDALRCLHWYGGFQEEVFVAFGVHADAIRTQ